MATLADTALALAKRLHQDTPALMDFCTFPEVKAQKNWAKAHIPATDVFYGDESITEPEAYRDFVSALRELTPQMNWLETYKDTPVGAEFREKLAAYELMGMDGPFHCEGVRGYLVYLPAGFTYPLHRHPSEEIYLILAGEADFERAFSMTSVGMGETVYHSSNEPHATVTKDKSLLAWALWRGPEINAPSVLIERSES